MLSTPPGLHPSYHILEAPETPGPIRARVNNLQNQVSELVRNGHAKDRKHRAELSALENTIQAQSTQLLTTTATLSHVQSTLARQDDEMARLKSEGNGMRDEVEARVPARMSSTLICPQLNLHSMLQQRKALLALAQEQMQVVELEQRLVQAEAAKLMRDHKLALFKAKEDDMLAELMERDAKFDDLEVSLSEANTSLVHLRAASSKANRALHTTREDLANNSDVQKSLETSQAELAQARTDIGHLETKIEKLEDKVKGLKEKEREARSELDNWVREEQGKEGSVDQEKKELSTTLRNTKNELQKKNDEISDLQEELLSLKETSKEREKTLKAKYREAKAEAERLVAVEEELESLRSTAAKTKKPKAVIKAVSGDEDEPSPIKSLKIKPKEKVRKTSPVDEDSDEEPARKKKPKKVLPAAEPVSEEDAPVKRTAKSALVESKDVANTASSLTAVVEKKKKRKLFGAQPTFSWDPILSSGDGVIPTSLSPVKAGSKGAVPRSLGRF
ncbi:hypothetical protein P7C73_g2034, partial [Tremellales sp. Uapishka_1]